MSGNKRKPERSRIKPPLPEVRKKVEYTQELAEFICAEIAGGASVRRICENPDMPCKRTVMNWLNKHEDFEKLYRIAVEQRSDGDAEETVDIADNDGVIGSHEKISRDKLRIDARKWRASRMNPKKYGDRVSAELSGRDGGPIQTETNVSDVEIADRLLSLILKAKGAPAHEPES